MIKIDTAPGGILSACFTLLYLSIAYIFFDITELDRGNTWIEFLTIGLCGLIGTISTLTILFFLRNYYLISLNLIFIFLLGYYLEKFVCLRFNFNEQND